MGKKKEPPGSPDQGSTASSDSATKASGWKPVDAAQFLGNASGGDPREQWFTYLDTDGDGTLTQSEVFIGLCRLLEMEAKPELVRPVRQLLSACWKDWVATEGGHVTKEAFLKPHSGL